VPGLTSGLRANAVRGVLWTALQKWYSRFAQLITLVVLARVLDSTTFGLVALASVFVMIIGALAELGLTTYLVQADSIGAKTGSTALWCNLAAAGLLCAVLELTAPLIASGFDEPELTALIRVSALGVLFIAGSAVPIALLTRAMTMKPLALRQMAGTTVGSVGSILMALNGAGAWALVFQTLAPLVVGFVVLWAAVTWRPRWEFSGSDAKKMVVFGVPVLGTALIHQLRDRGDELVIGAVLGAQLLGVWVISVRLMRVVIDLFTSVVSTMALTTFAKVTEDPVRFTRAIRQAISAGAAMLAPVMVGLALTSPVLIPFIFGNQWVQAGEVSQIISYVGIIIAIQWLDGSIWWALRKPGTEFTLTVTISVVHLLIVLIAAPHGLVVLAWAMLGRYLLLAPIRVIALKVRGGLSMSIYADLPRIFAAVAVMAVTILVLDRWVLDGLPASLRLLVDLLAGLAGWVVGMKLFAASVAGSLTSDIKLALRR